MTKPTATTLIKEIEKELSAVKYEVHDLDFKIKSLQGKAQDLEKALDDVQGKLIPLSEWDIVKKIVFGVVGLALIAVFSAIIGKVIISVNNKNTLKALKIANWSIWGLLAIFVIALICWYYPRQTVEVLEFKTERLEYKVADELFVTSNSAVFFNGTSSYDIRLVCDKGRYLLKSFEVSSQKSGFENTRFNVGLVPLIPTPDMCVVRTQATHKVQVSPFLIRTYTNQWETNRFLVEAKE